MAEWKTETVPLKYPIRVGGTDDSTAEIKELILQELDVEGLELIEECEFVAKEQPKVWQLRKAIAAVCRVEESVIKKLHRDDWRTIQEKSVPFIQGTPTASPQANSSDSPSTQSSPTSPTT